MSQEKPSFLKNHADTLAIIAVNITTCAILISMCVSNSSRIDAANARIDNAITISNAKTEKITDMFYDLLKEVKK